MKLQTRVFHDISNFKHFDILFHIALILGHKKSMCSVDSFSPHTSHLKISLYEHLYFFHIGHFYVLLSHVRTFQMFKLWHKTFKKIISDKYHINIAIPKDFVTMFTTWIYIFCPYLLKHSSITNLVGMSFTPGPCEEIQMNFQSNLLIIITMIMSVHVIMILRIYIVIKFSNLFRE